MTSKQGLHICYGGLAVYMLLAGIFYLTKDKDHGLMFLCGCIIWVIAAFIWGRNVDHGD